MKSSREEVWYPSLLGGILSTYAATCPKSLLILPLRLIIVLYIVATDLIWVLWCSQNCPKYLCPVRTCALSCSDHLPAHLFLVQCFCFFKAPSEPQSFEIILFPLAVFLHSWGDLWRLLHFLLFPLCSKRNNRMQPVGWGLLHRAEKEVEKSQLLSSCCQCANKPPRN